MFCATMKPRRHRLPRRDWVATVALGLLILLAALLWFFDPNNRSDGHSRIAWPPATGGKP